MKLHFERWGTQGSAIEKKEKIIFLHGMGGTGKIWRPIAAVLEEPFQILAPDQRGHGKSIAAMDSYSPLDFGRDVEETLAAEGFFPSWVVGHSMGIRTACALAHLRPEFVKGLVLADLGLVGGAGGGLHRNLSTFLRILPDQFPNRDEARQFMNQNSPDPSIGQYLLAVSVRDANGEIRFPFDRSALLKTLEQARAVDLRPWIKEFGQRGLPVLLLRGGLSRVWTREEFEQDRSYFADLPSIRFQEIPGTGHGLPFEKRQEFIDAILTEIRYPRPPRG
ncbi:MAG: hypothetical protein A2X94_17085 [Bdellovibrionales bacterium GWB1_55_8]|nr:MAG: hypothetical protein A2X94_17085 [Bdellovibrionales bacterium GWB1_55_8]